MTSKSAVALPPTGYFEIDFLVLGPSLHVYPAFVILSLSFLLLPDSNPHSESFSRLAMLDSPRDDAVLCVCSVFRLIHLLTSLASISASKPSKCVYISQLVLSLFDLLLSHEETHLFLY